jgi:hypothetical protein
MTPEVEAAVRTAFPHGDTATILGILDLYGTEPYERERERVQLAIVLLSQGTESKLVELVQTAKIDYRDILCWAEDGSFSSRKVEGNKRLREACWKSGAKNRPL